MVFILSLNFARDLATSLYFVWKIAVKIQMNCYRDANELKK